MLTAPKKRFEIKKLEERIAPSGCGGHRPEHNDCGCGGGGGINILNGSLNGNHVNVLSDNNVLIGNSFGGGKSW